jgi:SPP1 gp7 family putative phage head morphogenesis protein
VTLLLVGAGVYATAKAISGLLGLPLLPVRTALQLEFPHGIPKQSGTGPTANSTYTSRAKQANIFYQAGYVLNASNRMAQGLQDGKSIQQSVVDEKSYLQQHLTANRVRVAAATNVGRAVDQHGTTLGWHSRNDARTSPECRAAHGNNFDADHPPAIGYPGAVHNYCRCEPGVPFQNGGSVNTATKGVKDE